MRARQIGFVLFLLARLPFAVASEASASVANAAIRQMEAKQFSSASGMLASFLRTSPQHADLWNLLGICESELNHAQQAREAFSRGLQIAPDFVPLHENLGLLEFNAANYAEARKHLARAIQLGSTKPGVAYSLAASMIRTGEEKQGLTLLRRIEPDLAKDAEYWTERGWAELRSGDANASRSFDHALELAPSNLRALHGAASAAEAAGNDERAVSLLLRAKQAYPDDLRTLLHFGTVCLRRDLDVDALAALEHAHQIAPDNNLAVFLLGRAQLSFQDWQKSHDLFSEFNERVPRYAPALYALGWLDIQLNRRDEARKHFRAALAVRPDFTDVQYELGQLDLNEDNLDGAETQIKRVLAARPDHSKALIALGDLQLRRGDLAAAQASYERAVASDAKSGPAHYKLSIVLRRLRQTQRADVERDLGTRLNADALRAAKNVLVLADPEGNLLSGGTPQ